MNTIRRVGFVAILSLFVGMPQLVMGWGVGDKLPPLESFELQGKLPPVDGQLLLVDCWASWCGPCKKAFPVLGTLQKDYGDRGLVVLGVSVDSKEAAYSRFMEKNDAGFPTVWDQQQLLIKAAAVRTMPSSFLIDRSGTVRYVHSGFRGRSSEAELREHIETLLAE